MRAAWCSFLILACSSASAQRPASRQVDANVEVSFSEPLDELPFDPRAERLSAAGRRIEGLLGRRLEMRIDAALLPSRRSAFEEVLIVALENVAGDLARLSEDEPEVLDYATRSLSSIQCRYDPARDDVLRLLDVPTRTLWITLPPGELRLVPRGLVADALGVAYARDLERKWADVEPDAVPASAQAPYFRFLTETTGAHRRAADLSRPEGYLKDPRALRIQKVVRFSELVKDPALEARVRSFLAREADYFVRAYLHYPSLVAAAPRQSAFHRAEDAWVAWFRRHMKALDDADRLAATKKVFLRMFNRDVAEWGRYPEFAFPGLDPFELGLDVVDEWRSAGHPVELPARPERGLLFEFVVCPHPIDDTGARPRAPRCEYDWYGVALSRPGGIARLGEALARRRDETLTTDAFINVLTRGTTSDVLALWRATEADDVTWTAATRALAEEAVAVHVDGLLDESRRLWREHPERRGRLLYLLSLLDRYDNGRVPWSSLPKTFGAPVRAWDFEAFLDQGYRALSTAAVVWPALDRGWSRSEPIVRHLDAYLDDPRVRHFHPRHPWTALSAIVSRLCEEKATKDLSLLHAALEGRARRRPSEHAALSNLIQDTRPNACRR